MGSKTVTAHVVSIDNAEIEWAKTLVVLNGTSPRLGTVGESPVEGDAYDDAGAMHYVIAVILIYSSAVIGVFILGFFSRRHKETLQIDEQANYFLKDLNQTRIVIERQQRKTSIRQYARSISLDPALLNRKGETVRSGVLSIALPMTSVAVNDEETSMTHESDSRVSKATFLTSSGEYRQQLHEEDGRDTERSMTEGRPLLENGNPRTVRHAYSYPPDKNYKNVQESNFALPLIREEV